MFNFPFNFTLRDSLGNRCRVVDIKVTLYYPDDPEGITLENCPLITLASPPALVRRAICRVAGKAAREARRG